MNGSNFEISTSDIISIIGTIITVASMIVTIYFSWKIKSIKQEIEFNVGKSVILDSKDFIADSMVYARDLIDFGSGYVDSRGKKHQSTVRELQEIIDNLIHKLGKQNIDLEFNGKLKLCSEKLKELRNLKPNDKEFLEHSCNIHKLLQECYEKCANIIIKRD